LGANPGKPRLGKPTVATLPPNCTPRLRWSSRFSGSARHTDKLKLELQLANRPSALSNARSLAASTFTTLAEIKPALVTKRTCVASLTTCSLVTGNSSSVMKKPALRICGTNSAAEYAEAMKQIEEHKYPTPQEELVKAMGKAIEKAQKELLKGQKDLLDNMTESLEEGSVKTRGAIQYCTGWLLIAAACIVFALGRSENSNPSPNS
jgi:hypothetical protein